MVTFNYNSFSLPVPPLPFTLAMPSSISLGATTYNPTNMQMWGQGRPRGKSFGMQIKFFIIIVQLFIDTGGVAEKETSILYLNSAKNVSR